MTRSDNRFSDMSVCLNIQHIRIKVKHCDAYAIYNIPSTIIFQYPIIPKRKQNLRFFCFIKRKILIFQHKAAKICLKKSKRSEYFVCCN